jgi:hypothetical protein
MYPKERAPPRLTLLQGVRRPGVNSLVFRPLSVPPPPHCGASERAISQSEQLG